LIVAGIDLLRQCAHLVFQGLGAIFRTDDTGNVHAVDEIEEIGADIGSRQAIAVAVTVERIATVDVDFIPIREAIAIIVGVLRGISKMAVLVGSIVAAIVARSGDTATAIVPRVADENSD
jgi:hypothetical protein